MIADAMTNCVANCDIKKHDIQWGNKHVLFTQGKISTTCVVSMLRNDKSTFFQKSSPIGLILLLFHVSIDPLPTKNSA